MLIFSITVEPLLWDTSIQGTPPFKGKKILVTEKRWKKFLYLLSLLKEQLYSGVKERSFWDLKLKCSLVKIVTAF